MALRLGRLLRTFVGRWKSDLLERCLWAVRPRTCVEEYANLVTRGVVSRESVWVGILSRSCAVLEGRIRRPRWPSGIVDQVRKR